MISEGSNKFKLVLLCLCIFCIQNISSISMKLIILEIAFVFTKNIFLWGVLFIKFHTPQARLCSVKCFTRIPVVIWWKRTVAGGILSFNGMVCIINKEFSRSKTLFLTTLDKSKISTNVELNAKSSKRVSTIKSSLNTKNLILYLIKEFVIYIINKIRNLFLWNYIHFGSITTITLMSRMEGSSCNLLFVSSATLCWENNVFLVTITKIQQDD